MKILICFFLSLTMLFAQGKTKNPMEITDEMRSWAKRQVLGRVTTYEKTQSLLNGLFSSKKKFNYTRWGSYSAIESFDKWEGNCLSLTVLYVALSRAINIKAHAVMVKDIINYHQEGSIVVQSGHVIAVVHHSVGQVLTVDFLPSLTANRKGRLFKYLEDFELVGLMLNNKGTRMLLEGNYEEAYSYLKEAEQVWSNHAPTLSNLAVVCSRLGKTKEAEIYYQQALANTEDGLEQSTYYRNMALLYARVGRNEESTQMYDLAAEAVGRNPFFLLELGRKAKKDGRFDIAMKYYKKAWKYGKMHDSATAISELYGEMEEKRTSRRWAKKAKKAKLKQEREKEKEQEN